jgi:hypothetical protein
MGSLGIAKGLLYVADDSALSPVPDGGRRWNGRAWDCVSTEEEFEGGAR